VTIHYELILLYAAGLSPKDIAGLGFSRSAAYRFHRIYRDARKRARTIIIHRNSVSPDREYKIKNPDYLPKKKSVSLAEKLPWIWTYKKNGTITARRKRKKAEEAEPLYSEEYIAEDVKKMLDDTFIGTIKPRKRRKKLASS